MVKRQRKNLDDDDDSPIDPTTREYIYDEVDEYNELGIDNNHDDLDLSDSDDEVESGPGLINKDKRKEQVLGLDLNSSDEDYNDYKDEEDDIAGFSDDIENSETEQQGKDTEENRSMGRWKKDYYGTDITDQRLFNIGRQRAKKNDEDNLQIEMEGAIALQRRTLTSKFGFDFDLEPEPKGDSMEEQLQPGFIETKPEVKKPKSKLKLKKEMLKKFSDFDNLAKEVCEELKLKLIPLIEAHKRRMLPKSFDADYLITRYFLCLNFMTTFSAEKMLIASETDMEGHSVEKRLLQYRELFKTMESCKRKYESELDPVLDDLNSGKLKKKRKVLGIVHTKKTDKIIEKTEKNRITEETEANDDKEEMDSEDGDLDEVEENVKEPAATSRVENVEGKRLVTEEIKRNKGIIAARKKEQNNPRLKYKKKFQKKLKKRKGQVRQVRKELRRYDGEISGINRNAIKSITLK